METAKCKNSQGVASRSVPLQLRDVSHGQCSVLAVAEGTGLLFTKNPGDKIQTCLSHAGSHSTCSLGWEVGTAFCWEVVWLSSWPWTPCLGTGHLRSQQKGIGTLQAVLPSGNMKQPGEGRQCMFEMCALNDGSRIVRTTLLPVLLILRSSGCFITITAHHNEFSVFKLDSR